MPMFLRTQSYYLDSEADNAILIEFLNIDINIFRKHLLKLFFITNYCHLRQLVGMCFNFR